MIDSYLVDEKTALPLAHYKLYSTPEKILFTIDAENRITGFLTELEFPPFSETARQMTAGDIRNVHVRTIAADADRYREGRNLIADYPSIRLVPVTDSQGRPIDVIKPWQLFFKEEYFTAIRTSEPVALPYPQYAAVIWRAADVATAVGIRKFNVLEFGVAEGEGLIACELLSREIARIWGVEIGVCGFDGGAGLPETSDYRDCPQCWHGGQFPMDLQSLAQRLGSSTLVLGNIAETWPAFLAKAGDPVAAILVDVDYYTSTVPILAALEAAPEKFLPIVNMYFDDIGGSMQFQGEALAIREFNQRNDRIKISPEAESFGEFNFGARRYGFSKLKVCMFYDHPLFTQSAFKRKILHDFWR